MPNKTIHVDFDTLERFMQDVFTGIDVPLADSKICADVLISADKLGIDSHGINRMKPFYYDRIKAGIQKPVTKFEIIKDGFTTALVDGNTGMGQVIAKKSMEITIEKAKKYGMGMVATKNSTHFGIAGYYAMMAAKAGMIGICGTNARPSVAPTFGVDGMHGTNPLTFAVPTDEDFPFVIDCATSLTQRGKIEVYARQGKPVPEGWVIGRDGESITDSNEFLEKLTRGEAAFLPIGGAGEEGAGYKSYGYSIVVEILSAALQGGAFLKGITGVNLGHFFMAMDISAFTELDDFKKITGDILRELRNSRKEPGAERIYTAGEKEYLAWLDRKDKGAPVNENLLRELMQMRDELGLVGYEFG